VYNEEFNNLTTTNALSELAATTGYTSTKNMKTFPLCSKFFQNSHLKAKNADFGWKNFTI